MMLNMGSSTHQVSRSVLAMWRMIAFTSPQSKDHRQQTINALHGLHRRKSS
jgi:hypothetical protein